MVDECSKGNDGLPCSAGWYLPRWVITESHQGFVHERPHNKVTVRGGIEDTRMVVKEMKSPKREEAKRLGI